MRFFALVLALAACGNPGSATFDIDAAPCDFADAGVHAISLSLYSNVEPALTADGRGAVMVVWTVLNEGRPSTDNFFALSEDDGATFSMPGQLPNSDEGNASVATDGDGAFYVASLSRVGVYVNRIDAATGFLHNAVRVTDATSVPDLYSYPQIGVHNDGTLVVAFVSTSDGLRVGRSTDQGLTFTSAFVDSGDGGATDPRFCLDRNGGTTAPWYLIYRGGGAIHLRRSTDGGATWIELLSALPGAGAEMPRCAVRGDDVWFSVAGGVNARDEILVFHSSDGGSVFGTSTRAAQDDLIMNSALAVTDAGTLVVAYSSVLFGRARFKIAQSSGGSTFACSRGPAEGGASRGGSEPFDGGGASPRASAPQSQSKHLPVPPPSSKAPL